MGEDEHVKAAERRDGVRHRAAACAGSPTSAGSGTARPPSASIAAAVARSGSGRRPTSATACPPAASRLAVAAPIPVPAPVTRALRASVTRRS